MGTSISQQSPRGVDNAGPLWNEFSESVEDGAAPLKVAQNAFEAFAQQHESEWLQVVNDKGVRIVQQAVERAFSENSPQESLTVMMRSALSKEKANSFFAELAVMAANDIFPDKTSTRDTFISNYLGRVAEYFINRDMPKHVGSLGNPNLNTTSRLVMDVKTSITKAIPADSNLDQAAQSLIRKKP